MSTRCLLSGLVFLTVVVSLTLPLNAQNWVLYDDFKGPFINPALWIGRRGVCENSLDCERQIQGGKISLRIRGYGLTTSNSGQNWAQNTMEVSQPEAITGIGAKLTVTRATGSTCPGNSQLMVGQMGLRAVFFNSGSSTDPNQRWKDDVEANLYMYPHPDQTIEVGGNLRKLGPPQESIGPAVTLGAINIGDTVSISVYWDATSSRVVYRLQRPGNSPAENHISYVGQFIATASWYPYKFVQLQTSPQNCISGQVMSDMEAKISEVIVSR